MNLYESILQVSNCIKEKEEVKELIEKYKKVIQLRKNIKYSFFFSFVDGKEFYHFFAPNVAMQIINNIYISNDFSIISKEICELIINNEDIKQYVKSSTEINEMVLKEIMSLFNSENFEGDVKTVYKYNKLSEKLGYIGFINNMKIMAGKGELLNTYLQERKKIIAESIKLFPIHGFNDDFLKRVYGQKIPKELVDSFEKFNLILYIIERIIYCNVYDKIIYLEKENIKVISEKEKLNMVCKNFKFNNTKLIFEHFPILAIDNNYYFSYSEQFELVKEEAIFKCFTCKLEEKNALLNLSIIDTIELFKEE